MTNETGFRLHFDTEAGSWATRCEIHFLFSHKTLALALPILNSRNGEKNSSFGELNLGHLS